jgi:hypothetical protein
LKIDEAHEISFETLAKKPKTLENPLQKYMQHPNKTLATYM